MKLEGYLEANVALTPCLKSRHVCTYYTGVYIPLVHVYDTHVHIFISCSMCDVYKSVCVCIVCAYLYFLCEKTHVVCVCVRVR